METKIEKLDNLGRGLTHVDGKVTFIPKTIPEDVITFELNKIKKNYNEGRLTSIIKPAKNRLAAPCPYFLNCGGCDLQNLSYEDTISYKKNKVTEVLKHNNLDVKVNVIKNEQPYNYRNKITLKVVAGQIGFYEEMTHKIVTISKCLLANDAINKTLPLVSYFGINSGEIIIRANKNAEVLLIIKTKDKINIDITKLKSTIKLVGVVLNDEIYYGEDFLYENINGLIYRISYDSFFQVNPYIAEKLFTIVADNIAANANVLDIYSGVGTLSLTAARKAKSVIGIEVVPNAVLNAIFNAQINKINNTLFVLNDAAIAVPKIKKNFDTIIVDPPRAGLSKEVIDVIMNSNTKKVIYVSCNLATLERDLKTLSLKYNLEKYYLLDMFSYTYHVECVCVLNRKHL